MTAQQETKLEADTRAFLKTMQENAGIDPAEFEFYKHLQIKDIDLYTPAKNALGTACISNAYELICYNARPTNKSAKSICYKNKYLHNIRNLGDRSLHHLKNLSEEAGFVFAEDFADPDLVRQRLQAGLAFAKQNDFVSRNFQPETKRRQIFIETVFETLSNLTAEDMTPEREYHFLLPENNFDITGGIVDQLNKDGYKAKVMIIVEKDLPGTNPS